MAKFEPGTPKPETSGRKPGIPNKRNQEISEYAKEKGVSPAFMLIEILSGDIDKLAKEPIEKDDIKWAIDTLMPYMYGKRKPIDSDGNDSRDILSDILEAIDGNR